MKSKYFILLIGILLIFTTATSAEELPVGPVLPNPADQLPVVLLVPNPADQLPAVLLVLMSVAAAQANNNAYSMRCVLFCRAQLSWVSIAG